MNQDTFLKRAEALLRDLSAAPISLEDFAELAEEIADLFATAARAADEDLARAEREG